MNSGQKIIKIFATIFAIFLAVSIIGGIVAGLFFLFGGGSRENWVYSHNTSIENSSDQGGSSNMNYETYNFSQSYSNIYKLDIEASVNDVDIVTGDEFHVEMVNVSTRCQVKKENGTLFVEDSTYSGRSFISWIGDFLDGEGFQRLKGGTITITVPAGFHLDTCEIEAGTGSLSLNGINVQEMNIDAGTGSLSADGVTAGYVDLDCGTGSLNFRNIDFNGLDLDAGTGSISIDGKLRGGTTIECGVGSVYLKLYEPQESYRLDLEKGLGGITVNGSSYSSGSSGNMNAANYLSVEGGVGSITIDFVK